MAIAELKSVFRPVVVRRDKDAADPRKKRKGNPPGEPIPGDGEEAPAEPEKGKVDIRV